MVKILLMCTLGISTQKVIEKMEEHAKELDIEVEILSFCEGDTELIPGLDIILIGPQIRYNIEEIRDFSGDIIVKVMDSQNFGLLRGDLILEDALDTLGVLY